MLDLVRRMQVVGPRGVVPPLGGPATVATAAVVNANVSGSPALSSIARGYGATPRMQSQMSGGPLLARPRAASLDNIRNISPSQSGATFSTPPPQSRSGSLGISSLGASGNWTLWSFIGSTLTRKEFASEGDAAVAFDVAAKTGPCMLRDPSGVEAAARSWVASYMQQAQQLNVPYASTPSLAAAASATIGMTRRASSSSPARERAYSPEPVAAVRI